MRYGLDVGGLEVDAVEFLKQRTRMCEYYRKAGDCVACPAENLYFCLGTKKLDGNNATLLVEKVEKWAKENPSNTRQKQFLDLFPNTQTNDGVITICPKYLDPKKHDYHWCMVHACVSCKRAFWMEEIEVERDR